VPFSPRRHRGRLNRTRHVSLGCHQWRLGLTDMRRRRFHRLPCRRRHLYHLRRWPVRHTSPRRKAARLGHR
jgi:hypothetical protein